MRYLVARSSWAVCLIVGLFLSAQAGASVCPAVKLNHQQASDETVGLFRLDDPFASILLQIFGLNPFESPVSAEGYLAYRVDGSELPSPAIPGFGFSSQNTEALYSVNAKGGVPIKLSHSLGANERILHGLLPSSNPAWGLYSTTSTTDSSISSFLGNNLYAVPRDASQPAKKIFGGFSEKADVFPDIFTQSGDKYILGLVSGSDIPEENGSYRVAVDGSDSTKKLTPTPELGRSVQGGSFFQNDSVYIYQTVDSSERNNVKIFTSNAGEVGTSKEIDLGLNSEDEFRQIASSANSSAFTYVVKTPKGSYMAFYSVTENKYVKLTPSQFSNIRSANLTRDGKSLVFLASEGDTEVSMVDPLSTSSFVFKNKIEELYTVDLDGSNFRKVSGPLVSGGSVQSYSLMKKSKAVVYSADQDTDDLLELYHADFNSSLRTKISPVLKEGEYLRRYAIESFGDEERVLAYISQVGSTDQKTTHDVLDISIDGLIGKVNSSGYYLDNSSFVTVGIDVQNSSSVIAKNQGKYFYDAFDSTSGSRNLYLYDGSSRTSHKVNAALKSTESVSSYEYRSAINRLFYLVSSSTEANAYSVDLSRPGIATKINADFISADRKVSAIKLTKDNSRFIYVADQDVKGVNEIYSAHVNAATPPVKLTPEGLKGTGVDSRFFLTSDDKTMIYQADANGDGKAEIYSTCIDSGADVTIGSSSTGSLGIYSFLSLLLMTFIRLAKPLLISLAALAFVSAASAGDIYLGFGAGVSNIQPNINNPAVSLTQDSDTAIQLLLGGALTKNLDLEVRLTDLGEAHLQPNNVLTYSVMSMGAKYHISNLFIDNQPFSFYLTSGISVLRNDIKGGLIADKNSGAQLHIGGGAEYNLPLGFAVSLDVMSYDRDVNAVTLNLIKHFEVNK